MHQQSPLIQLCKALDSAATSGKERHDAVVMTEGMLHRVLGGIPLNTMSCAYSVVPSPTGTLMGMTLYLSKTFMGAVFHALLLAGIDQRKVLLVREDGRCDTVEWNQ